MRQRLPRPRHFRCPSMPELRLQIINSNDISVLASACATIMRSSPLKSPLGKEKILILNSGMKNYLSQYIATANGILAGADYMQLWDFIWQAYKEACGYQGRDNPFSRDAVAWSLMAQSDSWGRGRFREITSPLARYIDVPDADEPDLRLYELCSKIADTFDQYQMYRPSWILKWDELDEEDFAKWEDFREGRIQHGGRVGEVLRGMVPRRLASREGSIPKQVMANDWQPYLWSCLRPNMRDFNPNDASSRSDPRFFDRAQVIRAFIQKLMEGGSEVEAALPERIFVAGVSSLPGQVIELLSALGRRTEVYLLFLNPCREYWGDLRCGRSPRLAGSGTLRERILGGDPRLKGRALSDASRDDPDLEEEARSQFSPDSDDEVTGGFSPLLSASGREARDMLSSLCSMPEDRLPEFCSAFADPCGDDALSRVKGGMFTLDVSRRPGQTRKKDALEKGDGSLVFVSCHTRRREVEELRDLMLEKFARAREAGERLDPGDMLVMTPAIEEYAPDVEAVFGSVEEDDPAYIPYSLSDRQVTRQDPAADAILRIMGAGEEPVTVGFVLGLLAVPEIARTFGFADEDIDVISKWCIGSGIHWGLDEAEARAQSGCAEGTPFPWTFEGGLSRLLEGFMKGRGAGGGIYAEAEGSDAAVAGRFWHFVKCLREVRSAFEDLGARGSGMFSEDPSAGREGERPMRFEKLQSMLLDRFLGSSPDDGRKFKDVLWGLARIPRMLEKAPQVSLRVLRSMLSDSLEHKVDEGRFLAGKVNFCSMLPMRAVPFRHIFILGLNDGEFPRAERAPGFNLLASPQFFRRGDRSRPSDDRYLFLEAILSARDSLTLSYLGQDPSDGSQKEPSPVISELREWLDDNLESESGEKPSAILTLKSRLNAYDPKNYDKAARAAQGVPRLASFDQRSYVEKGGADSSDGLAPGFARSYGQGLPASSSVTPEDLASFLRSPCRGFLRHAGVSAVREEEEPEDIEPFELGILEGGAIRSSLLRLGDAQADAAMDGREASGLCPGGAFWDRQRQQILDSMKRLRKALEDAAPGVDFIGAQSRMFDSAADGVISFTAGDLGLEGDEAASFEGAAASFAGSARQYDAAVNTYSGELPIIKAMCMGIAQALAFDDGTHGLWLAGIGKNETKIARFTPFTRAQARAALRDCLRYYLMGLLRPLPMWPDLFKAEGRKDLGIYLGLVEPGRKSDKDRRYTAPGFGYDSDAAYLFGDSAVCGARKSEQPGVPDAEGPCFPFLKSFFEEVVFAHAMAHLEEMQ